MGFVILRSSRTTAQKRSALIKCFALDVDATRAAEIAKVNRNTANAWFRHFRELIYRSTRMAPRFFGEVEMDQSEFGGRGRKRMQALLKRYAKVLNHQDYLKRAREIRAEHKVLVFGILQRQGQVYAHIITKADKRTLQPIVRLVVEKGATVFTDKWRGFSELKLDGYTHRDVNHSEEYVAKDGSHINGIEAFWSFAKRRTSKFNGIARTTLILHIKECEFRYNNKDVAGALKKLLAEPVAGAALPALTPPPLPAAPKAPVRRAAKARNGSKKFVVVVRRRSH